MGLIEKLENQKPKNRIMVTFIRINWFIRAMKANHSCQQVSVKNYIRTMYEERAMKKCVT